MFETIKLFEKRTFMPLANGRRIVVYQNPSPREIIRAIKASQYQVLRAGWVINELVLWDAYDATHRAFDGLGYPMIIAKEIRNIERENDWNIPGTIYEAGCGCYVMGIEDFIESLASHFLGLTRIGEIPPKSKVFVPDQS